MIHIIHGDDIVSSRNRVSELTSELSHVIRLDAEKASDADLVHALSSTDMFEEKKCVVIEKLLKLDKKNTEKLLELITNMSNTTTLVLWHNTELSKVALGKYKSAKVEVFLLPKLFFTFLDTLSPLSMDREIELLTKMQNVEAEQIFYAMIKRIRQLLLVKSNSNSEELVKMSPWQLGKVQTQSRSWTVQQLENIYKLLFELEIKMKSGGLMLPLKKHLDIVLASAVN